MAKVKQTTEELTHVNETEPVKQMDAKLQPLKARLAALSAQLRHWRGLLSSYVDEPGSEREVLEARIHLPAGEIEESKLKLEIGDLEKDRERVYEAQQDRLTRIADLQLIEVVEESLAATERAVVLQQRVLEKVESRQGLGLGPANDREAIIFPNLVPSRPGGDRSPLDRLHDWVQRERARLEERAA